MSNLKINKWNIYNAKVPFPTDFSKSKTRPVAVIGHIGDDILIVPITTNLKRINKNNIKITLNEESVIKAGNIMTINKADFISPYYINDQIVRLENTTIKKIKSVIYSVIFRD